MTMKTQAAVDKTVIIYVNRKSDICYRNTPEKFAEMYFLNNFLV